MKDAYIRMRNRNQIDYDLLYTYAQERGMKLTPEQFSVGMQFMNINRLIEDLDSEFEVTRLYDKNDNFLKIVN
jgi:hypothetical protein